MEEFSHTKIILILFLLYILASGCKADPKFHNSEFTRKPAQYQSNYSSKYK